MAARNLFVSFTEYHLMLCISIIQEHFAGEEYENHIWMLGGNLGRIKADSQQLGNIQAEQLEGKRCLSGIIPAIRQEGWERVFVFHEYEPVSAYIAREIRRDCIRCLVEDGTAMYQQIHKLALPSRIRETFHKLKKSRRLGLLPLGINLVKNTHATSTWIQELWLTHPEMFKPRRSQYQDAIQPVKLLDSETKYQLTLQVFGVEAPERLENALFYIGRVSYGDVYMEREIASLQHLAAAKGVERVLIKPHPLSDVAQIRAYQESFGEGCILHSSLPAELHLYGAENCVIAAMDSTALYYNNQRSSYFVLYRLLQQQGAYPAWREIPYPEHVQTYLI
jgi:hypothetical protein